MNGGTAEPDDLAPVLRPGRRPQRPVGSESEAPHADVAEVFKGTGGGIERLDAAARRDVNQPGPRLDGQALGEAVAVLREYGARLGIELQQGAAARRGPDRRARGIE